MKVILSDPFVTVEGWTSAFDHLGAYELKEHKTPYEIKKEREAKKALGRSGKVDPYKRTPKSVLTKDPARPGVAMFLPGLWPRVQKFLDSQHYQYEIEDRRNPEIRPEPDFTKLEGVEFRPGQDEILAALISSDCGIVAASVGGGKSWLIGKLCRIYPTLNIVVTTNMVSVVNQLYKDISQDCPGEVGILTGNKDTTAGHRIIVSTINSLDKIPPDKVHLMLVDEAHCLGAEAYSRRVASFCFARRFGFTATPVRNDGTELVMESLVGPVIARTSYQESVDQGIVTPVSYAMVPCNRCPEFLLRGDLPQFMVDRFGYYRNRYRNKLIANFVHALKNVFEGQILIVCTALEHAIAIHQLLPWFRVAYSGGIDVADMAKKFAVEYPSLDVSQYKMSSKDVERMLGAFAKGTLRYLIATKVVKQGLNMPHLRCLIRADGTKSEIDCFQIPGRLSRLDRDKNMSYLIDFEDTWMPVAVNKAHEREKLYKGYGWTRLTEQEVLDGLNGADTGLDIQASPGTAEEVGS